MSVLDPHHNLSLDPSTFCPGILSSMIFYGPTEKACLSGFTADVSFDQ